MKILLLVADSLRAENTALHGYSRSITPFFDDLATESMVYRRDCREQGYSTGVFSYNPFITVREGDWAVCLNFVTTHHDNEPLAAFDDWGTQRARDIQRNLTDQCWSFYNGSRPWTEKQALVDIYDDTIKQIDAAIEHIYQTLSGRGELDDTLLILTANHEEGLGEWSDVRSSTRVAENTIGIRDAPHALC